MRMTMAKLRARWTKYIYAMGIVAIALAFGSYYLGQETAQVTQISPASWYFTAQYTNTTVLVICNYYLAPSNGNGNVTSLALLGYTNQTGWEQLEAMDVFTKSC